MSVVCLRCQFILLVWLEPGSTGRLCEPTRRTSYRAVVYRSRVNRIVLARPLFSPTIDMNLVVPMGDEPSNLTEAREANSSAIAAVFEGANPAIRAVFIHGGEADNVPSVALSSRCPGIGGKLRRRCPTLMDLIPISAQARWPHLFFGVA